MVSGKRLIIATLCGALCGALCSAGSSMVLGFEREAPVITGLILNRTFIGFMIGISAFRIHHIPHGILFGFVGSLPVAIPAGYTSAGVMLALLASGIIWGIVIEFCTTSLLKAPAPSIYPPDNTGD